MKNNLITKFLSIVVFCLGLMFSFNAYSITQEGGICLHKDLSKKDHFYAVRILGGEVKTLTWDSSCPKNNLISKKKYPKQYKKLLKLIRKYREDRGELNANIANDLVIQIIKDTSVYKLISD